MSYRLHPEIASGDVAMRQRHILSTGRATTALVPPRDREEFTVTFALRF